MPKTQSDIQIVIFELSGSEYGIPTESVREIVRLVEITPVPGSPDFVMGALDYRGTIAVVIDLAARLGLKSVVHNLNTQIIIIGDDAGLTGLIVDRVADVISIEQSTIMRGRESTLPDDMTIGAYEDEERLVLLLDIDKVLDSKESRAKKK
jgi:purine-binding chemotaxis protein CheW